MAFIDEVEIKIIAGRGGDGVVRWLRERGREFGGPSGGDGGNGGDVYALAVRDIGVLSRFRQVKEFIAEKGETGKSKAMHGKGGADLIIEFPIGSVIVNKQTDERFELLHEGERTLLLKGGTGGLGNVHFKSSTNQQPKEMTRGGEGESALFYVELQLIADAGLIGLPNAGKSSLLNVLTRANARVGAYAFTTLEPNLGVMYGFVLADIPGLIEGAAEGKGLGYKFLRHIKRTRVLVHCVSLEEKDMEGVYKTVRGELKKYDESLIKKTEVIVLTKSDLVTDVGMREEAITWARKHSKHVFVISIVDDSLIKSFSDSLVGILGESNSL